MKALPKISTAKSLVGSLFAVALMAWSPLQTRVDTIVFSISGGDAVFASNLTLGYSFTLSSAVTVTNLGFFDFGNDGLNASHAVTIWTSAGTQLAQATNPRWHRWNPHQRLPLCLYRAVDPHRRYLYNRRLLRQLFSKRFCGA